ncbi:hypothetical protein RD792_010471 [Penstemon davidsonii]|uniref:DIRP domain-containing protein n=1 Tax=Penstemon davidsonii TaxID=160366 RepID=A0ABR0D201_9LAMI|nr:hypothetical protein RD792_010471 [Penstemon davidsonii]
MMKISEISSSDDLRKDGSSTTQSSVQVPVVNQVNLPTRFRSRRKMNLKKPELQKNLKFPDNIPSDQCNLPFASLSDSAIHLKEKLSHCLLNQHLRQWCTYECFYSAIDYPWFAKQEFVEYLYHVGLGHVPRLTRVEWGVIRGSSLGKPRRFSEQFLKEEKEKLNQYRDTVRKHYTELREGVREGLPTDLSRPLSVGQRVIAIHPKTREIHDGSILTVDHSRCRVQFDHHELGVEFVMDIDCMPANPFDNIPALLGRGTVAVDRFFDNCHGLAKEYVKLSPGDNLDNIDVASINANGQTWNQQIAYSQPSTLTHIQVKDADVQALGELARALDKRVTSVDYLILYICCSPLNEAVVLELRKMNDDVLENQKDGESSLKSSEPFKKQYAGVLVLLNEANEQVSSALLCLRSRNTYQGNNSVTWPRAVTNVADHGVELSSFDRSACQSHESGSHVKEIMDSSRLKARTMVDSAKKTISSLKGREDSIEKIEEAIDYGHDKPKSTNTCDIESQIPSDLITKCVATLLMIQNCTERQFPPSDVAEILDSAVTSLHPRSSRNLAVYNEILKCMGIIRNQILALIPST